MLSSQSARACSHLRERGAAKRRAHAQLSPRSYPSVLLRSTPLLFCEETPPSYSATPEHDSSERSAEVDLGDWKQVHERILRVVAAQGAGEREMCALLVAAENLRLHERAGYASLKEYAARVMGLTKRKFEERLRVGKLLPELVALGEALANGELFWSAVRELSRIVVPRTERAWLDWARGRDIREVERAVKVHRSGDAPSDRPDPSLDKHVLRFEVSAESMAMFRNLQEAVRADLGVETGVPVDDDALLLEIARRALGGPDDDGRASYQVAVTRCDICKETSIDAAGDTHLVDDVVADMVGCDSQEIGETRPHDYEVAVRSSTKVSCRTARVAAPVSSRPGLAVERRSVSFDYSRS